MPPKNGLTLAFGCQSLAVSSEQTLHTALVVQAAKNSKRLAGLGRGGITGTHSHPSPSITDNTAKLRAGKDADHAGV